MTVLMTANAVRSAKKVEGVGEVLQGAKQAKKKSRRLKLQVLKVHLLCSIMTRTKKKLSTF